MNARDDYFYQAVIYAKEKDYHAARAMLRNLLYLYPDDIEGLLLFSIVAQNRDGSIQALKRILKINPDHEIAFAELAKLKYAPPESIPSPMAPLPPLSRFEKSIAAALSKKPEVSQRKPLESRLNLAPPLSISSPAAQQPAPSPIEKPVSRTKLAPMSSIPRPAAQEPIPSSTVVKPRLRPNDEVIQRNTQEPIKNMDPNNNLRKKSKNKKRIVDIVLVGLLILMCLLVSFVGMQELSRLFVLSS